MGYYRGDYYRPRGDYYRPRGDVWGALTGAATGFLTGGFAGAVKGGILGAATGKKKPAGSPGLLSPQGGIVVHPGNILPGGAPFLEPVGADRKKYRRINPTNVKALRRAIRREKSFIAVAKRALKGTGIHIGRTRSFGATKKRGR